MVYDAWSAVVIVYACVCTRKIRQSEVKRREANKVALSLILTWSYTLQFFFNFLIIIRDQRVCAVKGLYTVH